MHNIQYNSTAIKRQQIRFQQPQCMLGKCYSAKQSWVCYKCIYMCCLFDSVREALYLTDQAVKNTFDWYLLACV